jgi:hypothetical protein
MFNQSHRTLKQSTHSGAGFPRRLALARFLHIIHVSYRYFGFFAINQSSYQTSPAVIQSLFLLALGVVHLAV